MILYTVKNGKYYSIENIDINNINVYVNSTNRCSNSCTFCLRQTKEMLEGNSLWLKHEPTVEEMIKEFDKYDVTKFKEIVFCGFGEPLLRHDDLMKLAKYLKQRDHNCVIRINTNGLSSLSNKRDITVEFKGLIDIISVSLNAPTKEEYYELTRSSFGPDAFDEMLDFTVKCKPYVKEVVLSVVDIIGEKKIQECRELADKLGVTLRVREYEE